MSFVSIVLTGGVPPAGDKDKISAEHVTILLCFRISISAVAIVEMLYHFSKFEIGISYRLQVFYVAFAQHHVSFAKLSHHPVHNFSTKLHSSSCALFKGRMIPNRDMRTSL